MMKYIARLAFAGMLAVALTAPAAAQQKNAATISSFATFVTELAAISDAAALSTSIPSLQDPVGNACWTQMSGLQELIKQHPIPATMKLAADWEALRLLIIAGNQICTNTNCGQMWTDAQNLVAAVSNAPVPFSMNSFCAKMPAIATSLSGAAPIVVPPAPAPAPTPAPPAKP